MSAGDLAWLIEQSGLLLRLWATFWLRSSRWASSGDLPAPLQLAVTTSALILPYNILSLQQALVCRPAVMSGGEDDSYLWDNTLLDDFHTSVDAVRSFVCSACKSSGMLQG